jgi:hypothetical protein
MRAFPSLFAGLLLLGGGPSLAADAPFRPLDYAPAPVDNPLKGLVPYQGDRRDRFPHSLEFNYLPYASLVKGDDTFAWEPLERLLDDVASRGHQAIIRVYLEYPGKSGAIPEFLVREGLRVTQWKTGPSERSQVESPDYADPNLRRSLRQFIAALGRRYDGDPRLGFITAGLLGLWGEWHSHPCADLFAPPAVQEEVMAAYAAAFTRTPVLLRYPSAGNAGRGFGYHDDSFAWATLATGRKADAWFYLAKLQAAGPAALETWKTRPIGGEIRPEAWGQVFDDPPADARIQDFLRCVEATRVSWLMDSGVFRKDLSPARRQRAEAGVRRMGYEYHARAVSLGEPRDGVLPVRLEVENRGVAPFYADWRPEWALLKGPEVARTFPTSGRVQGLLPGEPARVWADALPLSGVPPGDYILALRVPNPLPGGKPLRFANATQDTRTGWLHLGEVRVR